MPEVSDLSEGVESGIPKLSRARSEHRNELGAGAISAAPWPEVNHGIPVGMKLDAERIYSPVENGECSFNAHTSPLLPLEVFRLER